MKNSSAIRSADYFNNKLSVTFQTGATYVYHGVPEKLATEFLRAESLGSFFHRNIRSAFPYHLSHGHWSVGVP
jgi:hypothetical protein